jgi:hypothetical protein
MKKDSQNSLTAENLDRFAEFLNRELGQPTLAAQIPKGAHIFHGSRDNAALTQANLQLISKILLGIMLGYVEDAPLMMVFEYEPGRHRVIDLLDNAQKDKARRFIEGFQEQSQHEMIGKIDELVPV